MINILIRNHVWRDWYSLWNCLFSQCICTFINMTIKALFSQCSTRLIPTTTILIHSILGDGCPWSKSLFVLSFPRKFCPIILLLFYQNATHGWDSTRMILMTNNVIRLYSKPLLYCRLEIEKDGRDQNHYVVWVWRLLTYLTGKVFLRFYSRLNLVLCENDTHGPNHSSLGDFTRLLSMVPNPILSLLKHSHSLRRVFTKLIAIAKIIILLIFYKIITHDKKRLILYVF